MTERSLAHIKTTLLHALKTTSEFPLSWHSWVCPSALQIDPKLMQNEIQSD